MGFDMLLKAILMTDCVSLSLIESYLKSFSHSAHEIPLLSNVASLQNLVGFSALRTFLINEVSLVMPKLTIAVAI